MKTKNSIITSTMRMLFQKTPQSLILKLRTSDSLLQALDIRPRASHRIIAVFFTLTFLQTLIPYNQLWANNNGPNAPEAAAFEPVDATDMVNLLTGDFSYVLPLMNVPSPEGGYPLALSYHGGIAHNQEASWTGLGWNLNPGSINRNINGLPDDWGKTGYEEFFYDAGWIENEYNFSLGVDINGFNIGLGASWGSHRSTGGFVSIGYGYEGVGGSVTIGTDGSGVGFGYNGFNASVSTNGVGIGYGSGFKNSELGYGISLNYNYNSGLSGGLSLTGTESNIYSKSSLKSASIGINFSSNGPSLGGSINGKGGGISSANYGISSGDYNVQVDGFQSSIPIYIFYVGFGHKRITYSLYKKNNLTTSGSVYPYHANETKPFSDGSGSSYLMKENYFMDVNEFPAFSHKNMSLDYLVEENYKIDKNNISLPGYDSYTVTSQGLSGNITPASYKELNLVGRGRAQTNNDNIYTAYVADNFDGWLDRYNDLGGYTNFYFQNEFSSFLRIDKSNIHKESFVNSATDQTLLNGFKTANTNTFNQDILSNGDQLKSGNRKRTGNYIETFTNKQIRDNLNTTGFIEAKNINRQQETDTFLNEGIGAFRITALDGKTYHYSLPVYNFEIFYKNFKTENQENQNFFEITKTKPYATHWLLTAITGPDYIDINIDGQVNKGDYGYWVEFDYGKWSDGYVWRGPADGYEEHENKEDPNDKTYSYYWGRKQIYYLDAVKTRTHTALFIKDLRADNTSKELDIYKKPYTGGIFKTDEYSEEVRSSEDIYKSQIFGEPGDVVYKSDGSTYTLPDYPDIPIHSGSNYREVLKGNKISSKYLDIPKNKLLKLSKVILIKNDNSIINKSRGSLTSILTGYSSINNGFKDIQPCEYDTIEGNTEVCSEAIILSSGYLKPIVLKNFEINQHNKVLDIKDIEGLSLEQQATQVIDFNYDYSLAQQSPNSLASTKGRLSLKSVNFKGKKGISLIPPYKFNYDLPYVAYNKDNQDEWGYHKTAPQAWTLNEITTPTGGKIKIQHEADSYYSEAAYDATEIFDDIVVKKNTNSDILDISFQDPNLNLNDYFKLNLNSNLFLDLTVESFGAGTYSPIIKVKPLVIDNATKKITFKILEYLNYGATRHISLLGIVNLEKDEPFCNGLTYCFSKPEIKSSVAPIKDFTKIDPNGRIGGGIRVASIEVKGENTSLKTIYDYTNLNNNNISGITSYAPSEEQKGIPYVSELPAPLITYGNVTMKNYDQNNTLLGSTTYQFDVLKPYEENPNYIFCLGDFFKVKEQQDEAFFDGEVQAKKYTIYNKLGDIGRVLSVASYNKQGQLLNKTTSNYKQNLDNDGQIGVSQQSYKSIKKLKKDNVESFLITSSSKIDYPSVIENTTSSQGSFTNTKHYDKHDFLTGQVTETRSISSEGTEFKTKVTPAYYIDDYTNNTDGYSMGAKVDNPTNKNMLTQTAATNTEIKIGNSWKTINASINTWNNNWTYRNYNGSTNDPSQQTDAEKIWRKHQTFAWKGEVDPDGAYLGYTGDDDNFNWTNPDSQTNAKWINTSTVSLYDHYSMPLESIDINENRASTKMGDENSKVFSVANAGYTEMYFSGAEDLIAGTHYFSGEVSKGSTATLSDTYHTGAKAIQAAANVKAFTVKPEAGNYKASVWVYKGVNTNYTNTKLRAGGSIISYHPTEVIPAGDWVQLNFYTGDIPTGQEVYVYNASGTAIYDDFRMLPIASSMSSYVYNEWDELSYIIGANNLATKYEYDDAGRLKKTYAEVMDTPGIKGGFKLSKEVNYNYSQQVQDSGTNNPNALSLNLGIGNANVSTTTLTATANGGSFEYEYRFAIGTSSSNLSYGGWSSSNTRSLTTNCTTGGRRYYKCQVRDKNNTSATKEQSGNHKRGNCSGGGPIEDPINEQ